MNNFNINEVKKKFKEIYKDTKFYIRHTSCSIDDLLERSFSSDYEVDLSKLCIFSIDSSTKKEASTYEKDGIFIYCFFNQKIKKNISLNPNDAAVFFNCDIDEKVSATINSYFYFFYSNKEEGVMDLKNLPNNVRPKDDFSNQIINIVFHDNSKAIKLKDCNFNFFTTIRGDKLDDSNQSGKIILMGDSRLDNPLIKLESYIDHLSFEKETEQKIKLMINQNSHFLNISTNNQEIESLELYYCYHRHTGSSQIYQISVKESKTDKLAVFNPGSGSYLSNHLIIDSSEVKRLVISDEKIGKLEITGDKKRSEITKISSDNQGKIPIPFIEEIVFRKINFENAFLIKAEKKEQGEVKGTVKFTMQDCKFSFKENEDGIFNTNKLSMGKIGYESYAMDFSSFANQARYQNLNWTLSSFIEKISLALYGLISAYGRSVWRMISCLLILHFSFLNIYLHFIPYFLPELISEFTGHDILKYSFANSLGFFKFAFSLGFETDPIPNSNISLPSLFFTHTALASVIWYLIIMWLKKRFGQK